MKFQTADFRLQIQTADLRLQISASRLSTDANLAEQVVILAPFGAHAHVQIQKHLRAEEALQLFARGGPDLFDHLAGPSDHDRLLRLAINDDRAVEAQDSLAALHRLLEAIDDHGARERNLSVRELQQLLADDLGGEEALGLIGQVV